jgi:hypothetical protein
MPETLAYVFHQENLSIGSRLFDLLFSRFTQEETLSNKNSRISNAIACYGIESVSNIRVYRWNTILMQWYSLIVKWSSGRSTDGGRRQCRDINDMALLETAVQAVTVIKERCLWIGRVKLWHKQTIIHFNKSEVQCRRGSNLCDCLSHSA